MTRVWSMATQRSHTEQDCQTIQNAIIYVCNDGNHGSQSAPAPNLNASLPLPPDNDSGYEASPSSATRLASFQFGSPIESSIDSTIDEELLSIDLYFAPIMLLENDVFDENQNVFEDDMEEDRNEDRDESAIRTESRNSGESGSSGSSTGSESALSTPIAIPSPTTSRNSLTQTSHLTERSRMSTPLALSHTSIATNSNRFVVDYNETGFGREMFVRHHRHRYHIGIDAISPQSPPSSPYWSPYIMGMVSPLGHNSSHRNNHNHYVNFDQSMTSAQSSFNYSQGMRQPLLPSPMSSISLNSGLAPTSNRPNDSREDLNNTDSQQPLPDVVNVEVRMRSGNGHIQARRAVSVSLPIDAQTIRSVGISLRRISEEFEISTSRTMLSNCGPESVGLFGNMLASIGLSRRRSLSTSRFGSHRNHRNGRQRSFSTNDATQQ